MHGVGDDDFLKMVSFAYIGPLLKQDRLRMRLNFQRGDRGAAVCVALRNRLGRMHAHTVERRR
jgi:hypothetical protein